MATLREAVESGRRYRLPEWNYWRENPTLGSAVYLGDAIRTDFEIEPEKPRVRWHHYADDGKPMTVHDSPQCPTCVRYHDANACDRIRAAK